MKKNYFKSSKVKSILLIIFVSILMFLNITNAAFASQKRETDTGTGGRQTYFGSWTKNADKTIYGKDREIQYDEEEFNNQTKKPGFVEGILIELLMSITDALYVFMDYIGITIDNVIYGRVGGHTKNGISLFRFELQRGNPYGVVAATIYNIIAGISILVIVVTIFGKLSLAMYYQSSEKWSGFKSSIGTSLLSIALLSLMPPLLDVGLYLADVILYVVSSEGSMRLFSDQNGLDIVAAFRDAAALGFVNSIIYLATIILSLYFAAIYIGYALTMVVLFVCFPVVCIGMNYDKKLLSQWGKQVLSILLIPILDCVLMMIPIYFGIIPNGGSMGLIKLFVCAMIVPARNVIRQLLGLSSGGLELTGVATMMGAMNLARAGAGAVNKFRGGRKAAKEDSNMSNYYSELAMNEGFGFNEGGNMSDGGATNVPDGGSGGGMQGVSGTMGNLSNAAMGGAISNGRSSYMGTSSITPGSRSAEKYANINNFENQAFKGKLSNEKLAELYRKRAKQRNISSGLSALGAAAGGVVGMGSGVFMGPAFSAQMGALGVGAGGAVGQILAESGSTGKSPEPTLYMNSSNSAQGVNVEGAEYVQGEVVEDFSVQDISGAETGATTYKSQRAQTVDFIKNNLPIASHIANAKVEEFTVNNGKQLKKIYEEIKQENNDKGTPMSNNAIRNEIRNRAADRVMADFRPEFNKRATREKDEMANQDGVARMSAYTNNRLRNQENGYFSEDILDTFDWMPRRDEDKDPNDPGGGAGAAFI